jgi:hypothetical protein
MDNIKVEQSINNQYPHNYIFTYTEICKVCINIKYLFELNLLVLSNRTNWFIYYNNSNINKKDIDNLFHINKKGIFTCNLFNESMNEDKIYIKDYDCADYDGIDAREYKKKFISCYINNNELENIMNKLNMYFNNNKFTIILENEIKEKSTNKNENNNLDKYILSYDIDNLPRDTISYKYLSLQKNLNLLNPKIKTELTENYTFLVLIENELETKTDLIELFTNAIRDI